MGRINNKSIQAYANQTARSATVAEKVSMMCHLLSAGAGNMIGVTHVIDGGWTAY